MRREGLGLPNFDRDDKPNRAVARRRCCHNCCQGLGQNMATVYADGGHD